MIIQENNIIRIVSGRKVLRKIPKGMWLLLFDEVRKEFYLEKQAQSPLPAKIYGNDSELLDTYLRAYASADGNLGVWFCGDKGCGKTLLCRRLIAKADLPTIIITQPFTGDLFHGFLSSLNQHCIVWLDEFEKVYIGEAQEEFLTVLDGTFSSTKLFLFTTNSFEINEFLRNRPGRIRYLKRYSGMEQELIEEVIEDRLSNKEHEEDLRQILLLLSNVSPDVLLALIDEMNLTNSTATKAVKLLNIQIEHTYFEVLAFIEGKKVLTKVDYNPILANTINLDYSFLDEKGRKRWKWYSETKANMQVSAANGKFVFRDEHDNVFYFTAIKPFNFEITDNEEFRGM